MVPPVVSIVGTTGAGKTTFLEGLILELKKRNLKVGVIKNDVHGFEIDKPGKSTWKFAQAGADNVMIVGPEKMALITKQEKKQGLDYYLKLHGEMDIVLTEGFKRESKPKIELYRKENSDYMLCSEEELLAVVSDDQLPLETTKPIFGFKEVIQVADFLEKIIIEGKKHKKNVQ